MKIGNFVQDKDGTLHGRIFGLGIGVTSVMLEPQKSKDGKSYFRVIAKPVDEAYEIGAAFPKDKGTTHYHSVSIESPVLPQPLHAALFADKAKVGCFNLIWNRPEMLEDRQPVNFNSNSNAPGKEDFIKEALRA